MDPSDDELWEQAASQDAVSRTCGSPSIVRYLSRDAFDEDAYVQDRAVVLKCFAYLARRHEGCAVCFYGHTHIPMVITDGAEVVESGSPVELRRGNRYLINPGSVGQPRDRVPTASFGLFDEFSLQYEHCRVEYPIEKTQMKIIKAGLPERLATRIAIGA